MIYKEEVMDLFSVPDEYYLAHCISADFKLGAGIALEFDKRFDMRNKLFYEFGDGLELWDYALKNNVYGECILVDRVLNLLTKEKYYHKPTLRSMTHALIMMELVCKVNNITKVAMPTIGCGLDKLEWSNVSKLIKSVFKDTDIEILVCKRP